MIDPSGSEVVFAELERAYNEMMTCRRFPAKFRRSFDEFLYKCHQLTEVMRKEYPKETSKAWAASSFGGWNKYTAALKAIRNAVVHGTPLILHEVIISIYPAAPLCFMRNELGPRQTAAGLRIIKGTCFIEAPFREEVFLPNVGFPSPNGQFVFPLKEFVSYELLWSSFDTETNKAVHKTGTTDVISMVLKSYPVMCDYFSYYQQMLKQNKIASLWK